MLDPSHVVTPSAEPAYCPACELKHMRRPDWLCPRCGTPVESEVRRPRARPAARREQGFPAGSRIAGALLALSGAALAADLVRHEALERRWSLLAAVVILAALGLGALVKVAAARWAAVGAAALAALVVAEGVVRDRLPGLMQDPLPSLVRVWLREVVRPERLVGAGAFTGFLAGGLLLLVGRPRRGRIAAGVVLAAPLLVLQALRALRG